jgi:dTDP-4-dehydrorhamnose reductase
MVVLVTGAGGQLGQSLQLIAPNLPEIDFVFCNSNQLNITDSENVKAVFVKFKPSFCINTAAYTAVDKAESEPEAAYLVNVIGPKNLAESCKKFETTLIHISTDFVFDGTSQTPYDETAKPNPTGVYGQTKLDGEKAIQSIFDNYIIIRTSWVYSQFGNNFMKTMIRLASEKESLSVVNDQIGTPTNAVDLAKTVIKIIENKNLHSKICNLQSKIFNYSNEGQCSWYEFAKKIFEIKNIKIDLKSIPSTSYPTPAKRPAYSVLDKSKIKNTFGLEIKSWEESLMSSLD